MCEIPPGPRKTKIKSSQLFSVTMLCLYVDVRLGPGFLTSSFATAENTVVMDVFPLNPHSIVPGVKMLCVNKISFPLSNVIYLGIQLISAGQLVTHIPISTLRSKPSLEIIVPYLELYLQKWQAI